jgi:hypothetical protein
MGFRRRGDVENIRLLDFNHAREIGVAGRNGEAHSQLLSHNWLNVAHRSQVNGGNLSDFFNVRICNLAAADDGDLQTDTLLQLLTVAFQRAVPILPSERTSKRALPGGAGVLPGKVNQLEFRGLLPCASAQAKFLAVLAFAMGEVQSSEATAAGWTV